MSKTFDREEFTEGYLSEAEEHLRSASGNLLRIEQALEKGERQPRVVRELFRSLHTLKGLSAMVGIDPIVEIAHEMEALLRTADQSGAHLSKEAVAISLSAVRAIEQRVQSFAQQKPIAAAPHKLIDALRQLLPGGSSLAVTHGEGLSLAPALLAKLSNVEREQLVQGIDSGRRALRIDFSPSPEKAAQGTTITSVRERVGKLGEIVRVLPQSVAKGVDAPGGLTFALLVLTDAADAALAEAAATDPSALLPIVLDEPAQGLLSTYEDLEEEAADQELGHDLLQRGTIRIDIARLDDALDKLSALVVTRFRLARAVASLRERGVDVRELQDVLNEHTREVKHLRTSITRARMVSVAQLLERVPLLVRGMSRSSRKQVRLVIDAGRSELDKAVAERIFPALLHLIRNAVDHAIEAPETRLRLGKPEEGRITVRCFEHSDSQLELSVTDDGCGIDAQRVAAKAGRPVPVDERGLLELITLPGLSTREQATEQSGRGMGMDIVKRVAVDTLGGELMLRTTREVGTTFTLRIPLSISILDSFAFKCGEQAFVVPLAMVEEIVELKPSEVFRAPQPRARAHQSGSEAKMLQHRGETIPLFDLTLLFGLPPAHDGLRTQLMPSALVVRRNGQRFAFAVESMLGQQEAVIRPLSDSLVKVSGISGTTDLGDGRPTLVLDLPGLSERVTRLMLHKETVA